MKDKKLLFGIILAFVFLLTIGFTYAYFSVTVNTIGEPSEILTSTGTLRLLYDGGQTIQSEEVYPGWTKSKTFTVTNVGSLTAYYSIDWENLTNTISDNELLMSLTCTGEGCATLSEEAVGNINGPFLDTIRIPVGVTHTYELSLSFIETSADQNYNQGKHFSGKIVISDSDGFFDVYGTLVNASDVPIVGATLTLRSDPKTTVTDENGNFVFKNVEADNHTITALLDGEEVLNDSLTIINGEKKEISNTTIIRPTKTKELNVKIKAAIDKSIASLEDIRYTLSPNWATKLDIIKPNIIAIAVEKTLESPSTYTFEGTTYNKNKNGIDVSQNNDGTVLASTYTNGTKDLIVMINSRGMTSLPQDSSYIFSSPDDDFSKLFLSLSYVQAENIDTSQVTIMDYLFRSSGWDATTLNIDLSSWDMSHVTSAVSMLDNVGRESETWSIGDLSDWDVSQLRDFTLMFNCTGTLAEEWSIGDLSDWDTSNAQNMSNMFCSAGKSSTIWDIGNINKWDVSYVYDIRSMFSNAAQEATEFNIDLSQWNTEYFTDTSYMFRGAGLNATTVNINLRNWNPPELADVSEMFGFVGENATSVNIDIRDMNLSHIPSMYSFCENVGANATTTVLNLKSLDPLAINPDGLVDSVFKNMNSNTQIIVGSTELRDAFLNLPTYYRPSDWNNSNFVIDSQ